MKEETELQAMMERLELENREVEGDEPEVSEPVLSCCCWRKVQSHHDLCIFHTIYISHAHAHS